MAFDLEKRITDWKLKLLSTGHLDEGEVEEIEDHLRSRIEAQLLKGDSEETAVNYAIEKVGQLSAINEEFGQAKFSGRVGVARLLLPDMALHYVKTASRSLFRNKVNAFLNIACLGVGLMCLFFISHFVAFHLSVDNQFSGQNLHRIVYHIEYGEEEGVYPHGPVPLGPTIRQEIPQVSDVVRLWMSSPVLRIDDELFYEEEMMFTDPTFFSFFSLPLILGDPNTVLANPNSVVLSESMAQKYFGDENPIGQTIDYNGYPAWEVTLEVTGVYRDLPENVHLKFNLVASLVGMDTEKANWGSFKPIFTYVRLREDSDVALVEEQLNGLVDQYMSYRREDVDRFQYYVEPVEDIHIRSEVASAMKPAINATLLWSIGAIGILILLLSSINYVNLSLAQLYNQFREVGIRKVFGSSNRQIRTRFFVGGLFTLSLSMCLAVLLVLSLVDRYEVLSGVTLDFSSLSDYRFVAPLVGIGMMLCLVAIYVPGIRLSTLRMQPALKGKINVRRSPVNSLFVLIQFALSNVLLVGTLLMQDQIRFIFNQELGVDRDYIVAMRRPPLDPSFKDALAQNANIESFAYSQLLPLNEMSYDGRRIQRPGDPTNYSGMSCYSSPSFLETFNIQLVAGRAFSEFIQSDSAAFIINERAVKEYGFESAEKALGEKLIWSGAHEGPIVGVIKDFHLRSLHEEIGPLVLLRSGDQVWYNYFLSAKINPAQREATIDFLRETFNKYSQDAPFDYFYVDESYRLIHAEDLNFSRLAFVFSSVAIVIALMGLFGLVHIDLNRMMKEIGIRKVLGSTAGEIFSLISSSYLKRIAVAFLLSIPVAVYFMREWLQQYAYRTDIKVVTIASAGVLILLVAMLTISWKTYRATRVNPARLLKEE